MLLWLRLITQHKPRAHSASNFLFAVHCVSLLHHRQARPVPRIRSSILTFVHYSMGVLRFCVPETARLPADPGRSVGPAFTLPPRPHFYTAGANFFVVFAHSLRVERGFPDPDSGPTRAVRRPFSARTAPLRPRLTLRRRQGRPKMCRKNAANHTTAESDPLIFSSTLATRIAWTSAGWPWPPSGNSNPRSSVRSAEGSA